MQLISSQVVSWFAALLGGFLQPINFSKTHWAGPDLAFKVVVQSKQRLKTVQNSNQTRCHAVSCLNLTARGF